MSDDEKKETYFLIHTSEVDRPQVTEHDTLEDLEEQLRLKLDFYNIHELWEDFICFKGKRVELSADKRRFFVIDGKEVEMSSDRAGPKIERVVDKKESQDTS